jgi:hypothetical protein
VPSAPLRATLDAVPARPGISVRAGAPAGLRAPVGTTGWTTCADLHDGPTLDALADRVRTGVRTLVPAPDRDRVPPAVAPSYLFGWYVWAVACAATVPYVAARRVPRLHPGSVALHLTGTGWPDAVALLDPGFACLPDDPDATHPDARPALDPDALRATLLDEVAAHVATFTAAWGRRGGRGPHSLRALATDALVAAVLTAAPGPAGLAEAEALLPGGPVPPRLRVSCCLAYAVPGAATCTTCPRLARAGAGSRT